MKKFESRLNRLANHVPDVTGETTREMLNRLGFPVTDEEIESAGSFLELMTNQDPGLKAWQV